MNLAEIAKYRLISQQITQTGISSAVEMVAWFGAMQAQEYAQAKWSLGLRLPHLKDSDIEKDFTAGNILRTHLLRPTWHFVVPDDIRWMLKLTAPRVHALNAFMYRKLELTDTIFRRCNNILMKSLHGSRQLTRETINKQFRKNKIKAEGHRLSYIMMQAELDGIICSGARHGNQFTYTLLEERVPKFASISGDEALGELTKRYFASRGPATVKDFSTWSGLTLSDCKKGVEIARLHFDNEIIRGENYFFSTGISPMKKQIPKFYLLPIYDEFIMGYKDRSAVMISKNKGKLSSPLLYDNMILCNGQITGTWRRQLGTKGINLQYNFFDKLNGRQGGAFKTAIRRFEKFNGLSVNY